MKALGVIINWSGFKAFTVSLVILKRFCVFFHLRVIKVIKDWWWMINCLHVMKGSARNKFWWSYLLDIWCLWLVSCHIYHADFSQVSVSFFHIGNIDLEQFIKFVTAIIFVVKSHLDNIFTVFLPLGWLLPLLLFWFEPGCHGYTVSKVHSIWHLLMCLFMMEFCIPLCFYHTISKWLV